MSPLDQFLLDAYLDGEMDTAASEAFEHLMLTRPDLAEQVDADTSLRMALALVEGERAAAAAAETNSASAPVAALVRPARRLHLAWAAAASVLLVLGAGAGRMLGTTQPGLVGARVAQVDAFRNIATIAELSIPASGPLILMVPVAASAPCEAHVSVHQSKMPVLSAEATPDAFGFVSLVADSSRLAEGEARIEVACGEAPRSEYKVQLRR